jgi:short-subunit dehydrogenase
VIGRRGIPGASEYCASKFALSGWTEALRAELAPSGVHVLLVSPGSIATEFRANLLEDRVRMPWQSDRGMTPDRCAELIVRGMRRKRHEVVTTAGGKFLVWLNRLWPTLVDRVLANMTRRARPTKTE